jgi:hypothetical protein
LEEYRKEMLAKTARRLSVSFHSRGGVIGLLNVCKLDVSIVGQPFPGVLFTA